MPTPSAIPIQPVSSQEHISTHSLLGNVTQSAKSHQAAEFGFSQIHKGLLHCAPNPWACGDSQPKTTYQINTKAIFTWKRSCCSLLMTRDRLLAVSESQLFDLLIPKEYEIQDCC